MVKKIRVLLVMVLIMMTVAVGQTSAGEENTSDCPATVMVVVAGDSSEVPEAIKVNPSEYFKVVLYAAAGTGYEWNLDSGTLTSIEMVERNVESVSRPPLVGGPAKWEFCLRVKPEAAGQETLHFYLSRSWEKNEKPARLFDLTVVTK